MLLDRYQGFVRFFSEGKHTRKPLSFDVQHIGEFEERLMEALSSHYPSKALDDFFGSFTESKIDLTERGIERLPSEDASFDVINSNFLYTRLTKANKFNVFPRQNGLFSHIRELELQARARWKAARSLKGNKSSTIPVIVYPLPSKPILRERRGGRRRIGFRGLWI